LKGPANPILSHPFQKTLGPAESVKGKQLVRVRRKQNQTPGAKAHQAHGQIKRISVVGKEQIARGTERDCSMRGRGLYFKDRGEKSEDKRKTIKVRSGDYSCCRVQAYIDRGHHVNWTIT